MQKVGQHPVAPCQFPPRPKIPRPEQGQQPRSPEAMQPLVNYSELRGSTQEGNTE